MRALSSNVEGNLFMNRKILFYAILFLMIIWLGMFATDLYGAFRYQQSPIFASQIPEVSREYRGFGYRISIATWTPMPGEGTDPGMRIGVYPLPYILINAGIILTFLFWKHIKRRTK